MAGTRSASSDMARVAMRLIDRFSMLGGGSDGPVSAPEQKPRPVPVSTTQVVALSSATSANAA